MNLVCKWTHPYFRECTELLVTLHTSAVLGVHATAKDLKGHAAKNQLCIESTDQVGNLNDLKY
jgi:hypothetical protein